MMDPFRIYLLFMAMFVVQGRLAVNRNAGVAEQSFSITAHIQLASGVTGRHFVYWECGTAGRARKQCGDLERAVRNPQIDKFCRPDLTRHWERHKLRRCLCKQGYIRNAWGECIQKKQCQSCRGIPNQDFNPCSSACPLVCGKRVPQVCTLQCAVGCACVPGYVKNPQKKNSCVSIRKCPPRCPRHATFKLCANTCAPRCYGPKPERCEKQCHSGECVCQVGFAKAIVKGDEKCVPWNRCPGRGE